MEDFQEVSGWLILFVIQEVFSICKCKSENIIIRSHRKLILLCAGFNIPFCFKALLTVDEAAHYTGIGVNKLRVLLAENPELGLWNGNRRLVKRVKFEKFLENTSTL